jgi:hypothetical protein
METTIKQVCAVTAGLVMGAVAAQAAIINTYDGTATSTWSVAANEVPAMDQWFTVPAGTEGSLFEFYVNPGTINNPAFTCSVAIYDSDKTTLVGLNTVSGLTSNVGAWLPVNKVWGAPMILAPGTYIAQVWSDNGSYAPDLSAVLVDSSTYAGGYAAKGWASLSVPVGDNQDFWARVTVESVPEPATGLILLGGLGLVLRRRSVKR